MERHARHHPARRRDIPICRRIRRATRRRSPPPRCSTRLAAAASSPARAGIALTVRKQLPLSGGQGGSAASAVAGAVAADALLGSSLETTALLHCCLAAEETVAGRHLDNIAPSLLGGIVLVRSLDPIDVVRLPIPDGLCVVLAHPSQRLRTSEARGVLPTSLPRADAVHQMAQVGAIVAACFGNDLALLGRAIDDRIAEPARAPLLPGFVEAKRVAMEAGALGASISGAGPTAFAFVAGDAAGERVAAAMREAYASGRRRLHDSSDSRGPQRRGREDRIACPFTTLTPHSDRVRAAQHRALRELRRHAGRPHRAGDLPELRRAARRGARRAEGEGRRAARAVRRASGCGELSGIARRTARACGASASSCFPRRAPRRSSAIPRGTRRSSRARRSRASPD